MLTQMGRIIIFVAFYVVETCEGWFNPLKIFVVELHFKRSMNHSCDFLEFIPSCYCYSRELHSTKGFCLALYSVLTWTTNLYVACCPNNVFRKSSTLSMVNDLYYLTWFSIKHQSIQFSPIWFLVVSFPPAAPPHLGCLLAWTLVLAPCFFFSPFLGCFLFFKKFGNPWILSFQLIKKIGKMSQIHTRSLIFLIKKTQKIVRQKHN
jgi:hypothetical protein